MDLRWSNVMNINKECMSIFSVWFGSQITFEKMPKIVISTLICEEMFPSVLSPYMYQANIYRTYRHDTGV